MLGPACEKGWMPNLNRFRQEGCWGTLRSTDPPITPAAWTSLMTGQNPGHHGVLGFQEYDVATNKISLSSSKSIRTETLWQKLARGDKRVVVVGVPMTYPPLEVNGYLVSGFDTPSLDCDFTYPPDFKDDIIKEIPDFTFERRFHRKQLTDSDNFVRYIKWLKRQSDQAVEIMQLGMSKGPWDVAMVLLRSFDELLHYFWKFLDFNSETPGDPRRSFIEEYFKDLDEVIGRLLIIAENNNALQFIISDHGGQTKKGNIYPNRVLRKLGYLKTMGRGKVIADYFSRKFHKRKPRTSAGAKSKERNYLWEQIDWSETRASVTEVNMYASVYLQVAGRGPHGIVDASKIDSLTREIAESLNQIRLQDGHNLFKMVARPIDLYNLSEHRDNLPDLLIAPPEGYLMKADLMGYSFIKYNDKNSLSGTHSMNGMFGCIGSDFITGVQVDAEIIDIAPTILTALGLPVTEDMNGRVLTKIFCTVPPITTEPPQQDKSMINKYQYSQQEEKQISSRLADLGYL